MSAFSNITVLNPLTAFGEMSIAEKSPIVQGVFDYTVSNTELNINTTTGSGTVININAMAVVSSWATTTSTALFQSKHSLKYNAGVWGVGRFTALFTSPVSWTEQYIGITDERGSSAIFKNGFTIGYTGTTLALQRWSGDTLTEIANASWDDKLDGTWPSGITIDWTKLNIFQVQYQYLWAWNIYFFVENPSSWRLVPFHILKYANLNTTPSVRVPNFKFTIWANNKATTSNMSVSCGSYGLFAEWKAKNIMIHQPQFSTGFKQSTTVTTEKACFTIKNKPTYPTATPKTNFIKVLLERLSCNIDNNGTTNIWVVRLVKNATLGWTPSYTDINSTNSIVSIDTAGTTVTGWTTILTTSLAGKNDTKEEDIVPFDIFIEPWDTITVAVSSTNSATINVDLLRKELF